MKYETSFIKYVFTLAKYVSTFIKNIAYFAKVVAFFTKVKTFFLKVETYFAKVKTYFTKIVSYFIKIEMYFVNLVSKFHHKSLLIKCSNSSRLRINSASPFSFIKTTAGRKRPLYCDICASEYAPQFSKAKTSSG